MTSMQLQTELDNFYERTGRIPAKVYMNRNTRMGLLRSLTTEKTEPAKPTFSSIPIGFDKTLADSELRFETA